MPYVILDSQAKKKGLRKVARNFYYCSSHLLKEYPNALMFQKRKIRKYHIQQRTRHIGYILLWYRIKKNAERNKKVMHRMIAKSLGFPLAPSLYAFPYIHYTSDMPFMSPQKIYSRAQTLGIHISKRAVLTPLKKSEEHIKEKAEHYIRRKYEHLIRRVLKASYDRKTRSEIRLDYQKLKHKGRTLSAILGIEVDKLEKKAYRYIWKWEKEGKS